MTLRFARCRKGIHQCSAVGTVIVMAMASLLAVAMVVATKLAMAMMVAIVLVLVLVVQAPWQERVH